MYATVAGVKPRALDSLNVESSLDEFNEESLKLYRIIRQHYDTLEPRFAIWAIGSDYYALSRWFSLDEARAAVSPEVRAEVHISLAVERSKVSERIERMAGVVKDLAFWATYLKGILADPNTTSHKVKDALDFAGLQQSAGGELRVGDVGEAILREAKIITDRRSDPRAVAKLVAQRSRRFGELITCGPVAIRAAYAAESMKGSMDKVLVYQGEIGLVDSDERRSAVQEEFGPRDGDLGSEMKARTDGNSEEGALLEKVIGEVLSIAARGGFAEGDSVRVFGGKIRDLEAVIAIPFLEYQERVQKLFFLLAVLFGHDYSKRVSIGRSHDDQMFLCFLLKAMMAVSSCESVTSTTLRQSLRSVFRQLIAEEDILGGVLNLVEGDESLSLREHWDFLLG